MPEATTVTGLLFALAGAALVVVLAFAPFIMGMLATDPHEDDGFALAGVFAQLGWFAAIVYYPADKVAGTIIRTLGTFGNTLGQFEAIYIPGGLFTIAGAIIVMSHVTRSE